MNKTRIKLIYVVTGYKHGNCEDPNMASGFGKIRRLRSKLPDQPQMVVCGTGQRHRNIASALELAPTNFTILAGTADSFKKKKKGAICVFADGTRVPATTVTIAHDIAKSVFFHVRNTLIHDTVVCASKSFLRALFIPLGIQSEVAPATVYQIQVDQGGHISVEML